VEPSARAGFRSQLKPLLHKYRPGDR